jgi:hypothetical protein
MTSLLGARPPRLSVSRSAENPRKSYYLIYTTQYDALRSLSESVCHTANNRATMQPRVATEPTPSVLTVIRILSLPSAVWRDAGGGTTRRKPGGPCYDRAAVTL